MVKAKKKKKKAKRKARAKIDGRRCCEVPKCDRQSVMGWRPLNIEKPRHICRYHWRRHCNGDDEFSLLTVFNIKAFKLDRFGGHVAKDKDEMMAKANGRQAARRRAKKDKSLERLQQWKKTNGKELPRRKRKKPPERPSAAIELDSVIDDILGGE